MSFNQKNRSFVGDYLNPEFTSLIDKEHIKTIVEVGSRDCLDAISLADYYEDSSVFCFPVTIQMEKNLFYFLFEMEPSVN